jgi:hypothetical protein
LAQKSSNQLSNKIVVNNLQLRIGGYLKIKIKIGNLASLMYMISLEIDNINKVLYLNFSPCV